MRRLSRLILSIITMITFISSCTSKDNDNREVVEDWIGKEIIIPANLKYQIGKCIVNYDFTDADFKIVTYINSEGCTSCKMKLKSWDKFIKELKLSSDITINFLMVINTDEKKVVETLLKQNDFNNPVAIDPKGDYDRINLLPAKSDYQTFLLDNNNKVLVIGNPVNNPKIKELYKQIIFDTASGDSTEAVSDKKLCSHSVQNLGVVKRGDTLSTIFRIVNHQDKLLSIQEISSSCHCVTAKTNVDVLKEGESADIEVQYIADSIPQQFYRYVDVWFKERNEPERLVIYGFIK